MENSEKDFNSDKDSSGDEENVKKSPEIVKNNLETGNSVNKNVLKTKTLNFVKIENHESNKRTKYEKPDLKYQENMSSSIDNVPVNLDIDNAVSQIVALFKRKRKSEFIKKFSL